MTITLHLAPEDEAEINDIAAKKGQDADTVAYTIFAAALAESKARHDGSMNVQPLEDEDLILSPEEESEAINLGLDDSFAGRVTPLAEWSARFRARHNLPKGGRLMSDEELMLVP